jgi:hypothetical protein
MSEQQRVMTECESNECEIRQRCTGHASCRRAKPPESVHPSHLSTVIEVLEADRATLRARVTEPERERDEARESATVDGRIISEVNAAVGRAGIHCAITFVEAIDQIARERDAATSEGERLMARQQELLRTIRNLSSQVPYEEESRTAATLIAEVGTLKARLRNAEAQLATAVEERDEARNAVLRPMTEAQVEAALHEGRAEAMAATGDNAWTSLLKQRDSWKARAEAAEKEREIADGFVRTAREQRDRFMERASALEYAANDLRGGARWALDQAAAQERGRVVQSIAAFVLTQEDQDGCGEDIAKAILNGEWDTGPDKSKEQ